MNKERKIKESLEKLNRNLVAAEHYIARNVNVRAYDWLHLSDWKGKSGHPLWMKNRMIPSVKRTMTERERALEKLPPKLKSDGSKSRDETMRTPNQSPEPTAVCQRHSDEHLLNGLRGNMNLQHGIPFT